MSVFRKPLGYLGAAVLGLTLGAAGPAAADYPERPITFMIPFAAGGGLDFVARILAAGIEERTGKSIIVDPRPGASGTIGANSILQVDADGYNVMLAPAAPLVNAPLLTSTVPYDAEADFEPVMKLVVSPIMVIVNNDVPAQNLVELVEYARSNPGEISIGNSGSGSTQQLLSLIFSDATETDLNMISYTGSGEIRPDLVAGRLKMMIDFPAAYVGFVDAGQVRILATLGGERHPLFPDVPTVAEAGFPQMPAWSGWFSMYVRSGTPAAAKDWLAREVRALLETEAVVAALAGGGYAPDPASAEEVLKMMELERSVLRELIEKHNL